MQQLKEIPLRNHRNLHELLAIDAHYALDGSCHIPFLGNNATVRVLEHRLGFLLGETFPARLGTLILRVSFYLINLARIRENQLHLGRRLRIGVFGAKHRHFASVPARFAVQRIGNRIENRRFAGAGNAGYKIEPACAELVKIKNACPCIGAESR